MGKFFDKVADFSDYLIKCSLIGVLITQGCKLIKREIQDS